MNCLTYFVIGLFLFGCQQAKEATAPIEVVPHLNATVQEFISKNISYDSVVVTDSLVLDKLEATLYRARIKNVFDAPTYTIIRDRVKDSLYSIVLPGWPGGLDPPCDTQLEILSGRGGPTHVFLRGLEHFINQRGLTEFDQTMDSVILFWWPDLIRIYDEAVINHGIMASLKSLNISTPNPWLDKTQNLISKKLRDNNVHFFSGPLYAELRKVDPVKSQPNKNYVLIAFRIGFQGCP